MKSIAIIIAALGLSNCAVVLKAPDCTAKKHNWTAWRTTKAADEWQIAVQQRRCTICGWTQTSGQ